MSINLIKLNNVASPRAILITFHHAGGNANVYRPWKAVFEADSILLYGVNLPNRTITAKSVDGPLKTVPLLAEAIATELRAKVDFTIPVFYFGHSLGGITAFEVSRRLPPKHLMISSAKNPKDLTAIVASGTIPLRHTFSDDQLFDFFVSEGGLPAGVHPDFLRALLPVARKDYKLYETYSFQEEAFPKLSIPLTTFVGSAEKAETFDVIPRWVEFTSGPYDEPLIYEGGTHFYIIEAGCKDKVLDDIRAVCKRYT